MNNYASEEQNSDPRYWKALQTIFSTIALPIYMVWYNAWWPTPGQVLFQCVWFGLVTFCTSFLLLVLGYEKGAYLTPVFFIVQILVPLFRRQVYKQVDDYVWFTRKGSNFDVTSRSYVMANDLNAPMKFTPQATALSVTEAFVKIFISIAITLYTYHISSSVTARQSRLDKLAMLELLQPGDTVFAKPDATMCYFGGKQDIRVYYKVLGRYFNIIGKDTIISNRYRYEEAYTDTSGLPLGIIVGKDTAGYSYYYYAISPFVKPDFAFELPRNPLPNHTYTLADSLVYLESDDITAAPSKLPPYKLPF